MKMYPSNFSLNCYADNIIGHEKNILIEKYIFLSCK